jgi:hypothetical protein
VRAASSRAAISIGRWRVGRPWGGLAPGAEIGCRDDLPRAGDAGSAAGAAGGGAGGRRGRDPRQHRRGSAEPAATAGPPIGATCVQPPYGSSQGGGDSQSSLPSSHRGVETLGSRRVGPAGGRPDCCALTRCQRGSADLRSLGAGGGVARRCRRRRCPSITSCSMRAYHGCTSARAHPASAHHPPGRATPAAAAGGGVAAAPRKRR